LRNRFSALLCCAREMAQSVLLQHSLRSNIIGVSSKMSVLGRVLSRAVVGTKQSKMANSTQCLAAIRDPIQKSLMSEECILVDNQDNIVGSDSKLNCHLVQNGSLKLHRAFSVFLFDSVNKLLLQQRSAHKVTFPNLWTNTCCSHPLFVEDEKDGVEGAKRAAVRRMNFELGIDEIEEEDLHYLTRIHYKSLSDPQWGEHEMDYIFFAKKDVKVEPNENEISAIKYVSMDDVGKLEKKDLTPWFSLISDTKLFDWWKSLGSKQGLEHSSEIMRFV